MPEPFQHSDGRVLKLGKNEARFDRRNLRLGAYLARTIPPAPPSVDYSKSLSEWDMMDNDTLGCCTIAALGHALQAVSLNTTGIVTVPNAQIRKYYSWFCGYVPGNPETDQGGVELDVLNSARKWGFAGRALLAYAAINPANPEHVRKAIEIFGFAYIGLGLPLSAQGQVGSLWDVVGKTTDPNSEVWSWGGHAVIVLAYDAETLTVVTWGKLQKMTWAFWNAYVDEAYALVLGYWPEGKGPDGSGFLLANMMSDLGAITA